MKIDTLFIILFLGAGFAFLYYALQKQLAKKNDEETLNKVVNQIFGMSANKIALQSRSILQGEKETIKTDLENKQKTFEKLVKQLQEDLARRQEEIRLTEKDRTSKFAELKEVMEQHKEMTRDLKVSTDQLSQVLSNNQQRGEWGERIIEDLLISNGLKEGVHYLKQSKQTSIEARPDITLLLPNNRNVPVDVKFPYSEIQKMSLAENKKAKEEHLKIFARDVKVKVDKVATYINPEQHTLDYAIMFIPNEMIFSFINKQFPDLVDYAIGKRVILVSPFTFLIVARTIMESYRNFMIGDKLKEVVRYVDEFVDEWAKFRDEFSKFGRSIDTLQKGYEKVTATRTKQMEKKIAKIESYRQGNLLEETKVKELS